MIKMGANKLAKRLRTTPAIIKKAREIAKEKLNFPTVPHSHRNFPKILIMDIETSPLKAYVWRRWK